MNRTIVLVILFVGLVGVAPWPVHAACAVSNTHIVDATFVTCEDVSPVIMERVHSLQDERLGDLEQWLQNLELTTVEGFHDWLLKGGAGVIAGLKVHRSRTIDYDRKQKDPSAPLVADWTRAPERVFVFYRGGSCESIRTGRGSHNIM